MTWNIVFVYCTVVCALPFVATEPFEPIQNDISIMRKGAKTDISDETLEYGMVMGKALAHNIYENDRTLSRVMNVSDSGSILFRGGPFPQSFLDQIKSGCQMLQITQVIKREELNCDVCPTQSFMRTLRKAKFQVTGICNATQFHCKNLHPWFLKYRTQDGLCNNMKYPDWGRAETPFSRIVEPNYSDGVHRPRCSVDGGELPSARLLSAAFFPKDTLEDDTYTVALSAFGQFIAHDITLQITDYGEKGPIQCCGEGGKYILSKNKRHHSCMPITVPKNDPFYGKYNIRCMNFVRSVAIPTSDCMLGPAQQMNAVTGYLDLSATYGSGEDVTASLRKFIDGLLRESYREHNNFLLLDPTNAFCDLNSTNEPCFKAGDSRVNQNLHLVALSNIFVRCHNKYATTLKGLNPGWSDEKLYQEAKRITNAVYQRIIYKEYLKYILGDTFVRNLFKNTDRNGYTNVYDENIHGGTINSFSIAFRTLHSTVPTFIRTFTEKRKINKNITISDEFFNPVQIEETSHSYDDVIRSLATQPMYKFDDRFTTQLSQLMFKMKNPTGLDLLAFDIQRSRDHGMPSYNEFRKACGLPGFKDFEDLESVMLANNVTTLSKYYKNVNDIDLYVGLVFEKKIPDTLFGPLLTLIMGEQFTRFMVGDRFFYSNKNQIYKFTPEQLNEIEKSSLAMLLCEHSDDLKYVQQKAFELPSEDNPLVQCNTISTLNLIYWKEKAEF